jgi:glycosyltransferase involved in cell wall biosynthesis
MRENVELIRSKSTVVPLGLNLNNVAVSKDPSDEPIFLWNHRWEYDKCPEDFLALLSKLAKRDYRFKVVILGQSKLNKSQILKLIPENLKEHILHVAPNSEVEEYRSWLSRSHILFVTAIQDFFGLSVVEGIAHGLYPLLPNRICYPERIPQELHHQYLYHSEEDGLSKLCSILDSGSWRNPNENLLSYCKQYDWSSVGKTYDELWLKLAGKV